MILAMVSGIIADILVHPEHLAKPVYMVAGVGRSAARRRPPPRRPGPSRSGRCWPARAPTPARTSSTGSAPPATPSTRATRTASARISTASFDRPIAEGHGGYAFSSALKAQDKGKTWTPDLLNAWLYKPQDFAHGHQDDLRRPAEGEGPRRRHRLSQLAERQPEPLTELGRRRRRPHRRRRPPAPAAPHGGRKPATGRGKQRRRPQRQIACGGADDRRRRDRPRRAARRRRGRDRAALFPPAASRSTTSPT